MQCRTTIAMVVVILAFSSLFIIYALGQVEESYKYSYLIQIEPCSDVNFTIYVPLPIEHNHSISPLVNGVGIVSGGGAFEIVDTQHGKALKVSSNGKVQIMSSANKKLNPPFLSMKNGTYEYPPKRESHVGYWALLEDAGNVTVSVRLEYSHFTTAFRWNQLTFWTSGTMVLYEIGSQNLNQGWQELKGTTQIGLIN